MRASPPHILRTSGQRSSRVSAVTRRRPNTLAVVTMNLSAGSSYCRRSRRLAVATAKFTGASRTVRAASRSHSRGLGERVIRPFSASRAASQRLIGDSLGRSGIVSRAPPTEAGRRSGQFNPQSQTCVSRRNGSEPAFLILIALRWTRWTPRRVRHRAFRPPLEGDAGRRPALPLSRTVYTVLVFAARGTCGSSMGCGNQRRGRLPQYEKSGLTERFPVGRRRCWSDDVAVDRDGTPHRAEPTWGWRNDLGDRCSAAGHQNRFPRLRNPVQDGEAGSLEL